VTIISSPAGFDDQAFNDNALSGLEQAAEEWDVSINQVEETNQGQYAQRQADAAEAGPDLIVLVADQHTDPLRENARSTPTSTGCSSTTSSRNPTSPGGSR